MENKSEMINRIAELAEENAKLNAIIDGYQPRLQALKVEIAELQAYKDVNEDFKTAWEELKVENEKLKEEIKEVKKYQYEQEFLEKEIEEQREKNKRLTCKILEVKALNETLNVQCTSQDCTQLRKLYQTLQEIKEIAEQCMNKDICYACEYVEDCYIEDAEIPTYDICKLLIQKITKAEEE